MNQILNMFMRLVMRKMMSKGIDAGFKGASGMARRRKQQQQPMGEIDDYGNPTGRSGSAPKDTSERDRIRAERRARRASRQQD